MTSVDDKIKEVEEEIRKTPYNKATQHHIGKLKAKLAQLKDESLKRSSSKGGGLGFGVKKSGDATAVLIGFPSVGKSTLINKLTNADSEVADYDFTTVEVIPGMMEYSGVRIQILDLPGIITGASIGRGRGREVLSITRNADVILILVDVRKPEQAERILEELHNVGVRPNQRPPKIDIKKTSQGGVKITEMTKVTKIDDKTVKSILNAYSIHNAEVTIHEDVDEDRFIDAVSKNKVYVPSLVVLNKTDLSDANAIERVKQRLGSDVIGISALKESNLQSLRRMIYDKVDVIRVYMKPHGREADMNEPLILKKGSGIGDVCDRLHKDLKNRFRYAMIWGKSVKYGGQRKGLGHKLADGDVVTIVKKN